jgi:VanZ family protein
MRTNEGLLEPIPPLGYGISKGLGKREARANAASLEIRRGPMPAAKRYLLKRWARIVAAFYVALLTTALLAPDPLAWLRTKPKGPKKPPPPYLAWLFNDKTQHFVSYAILTGLILEATRWTPAVVFSVAASHGGLVEVLQDWFPPRETDLQDWIADLAGVLCVLLVYRFLPRRRSD